MVLISFTNIVVDDFFFTKRNPLKRYIYFLTHMHSDHYKGLSNHWDNGNIYCSETTRKLLLQKFPLINHDIIHTIGLNQPFTLKLSSEIKIKVEFFNANHCPGSVMIYFEGYFGKILHTGDFRFDPFEIDIDRLPKKIDELILDNTFCDPIFKFPNKQTAFQQIVNTIENQQNIHQKQQKLSKESKQFRVILSMGQLGKEDLLCNLSEYFQTSIIVDENKYQQIINIGELKDKLYCFSTNFNDGWIQISSRNSKQFFQSKQQQLDQYNYITIMPSGWSNIQAIKLVYQNKYVIPYSCHSNFSEMEDFVKIVNPSIINPVVYKSSSQYEEEVQEMYEFGNNENQLLFNKKQNGLKILQEKYCDLDKISEEYKELQFDINKQEWIKDKLGINLTEIDEVQVNKQLFLQKNQNIFKNNQNNNIRDGGKIAPLNENLQKKIQIIMKEKSKNLDQNIMFRSLNNNIIIDPENELDEQKILFQNLKSQSQILDNKQFDNSLNQKQIDRVWNNIQFIKLKENNDFNCIEINSQDSREQDNIENQEQIIEISSDSENDCNYNNNETIIIQKNKNNNYENSCQNLDFSIQTIFKNPKQLSIVGEDPILNKFQNYLQKTKPNNKLI